MDTQNVLTPGPHICMNIIMKAVKSDLRVDVHAVNLFCNLLNNQE